MNVNRSTYYKHFFSKPSNREIVNTDIKSKILKIYVDFKNSIGGYKIKKVLLRDYGINISAGRVYRLMNSMNLPKAKKAKPKWKSSTTENKVCENHLKQQFNPKSPNKVWASDFTYVKVNGHWYYLCVVMDLFSRKIIGWNLSSKHDVDLVKTAFEKAYEKRKYPKSLMFHSDRGCEYNSSIFRNLLERYGICQSFSKKGYPYDNACLESFFKQMKSEEIERRTYKNIKELYFSCFEYIQRYNNKRPHGSLGYLTPNEYEQKYKERSV